MKTTSMNILTALIIADEATQHFNIKHYVRTDYCTFSTTAFLSNGQVKYTDGSSSNLSDVNRNFQSVCIVRSSCEWSDPISMKGWQMCVEADRRFKAGEDARVNVWLEGPGTIECKWRPDGPKLFEGVGGPFDVMAGWNYTVQWPIKQTEECTEQVIDWWSKCVLEGLR